MAVEVRGVPPNVAEELLVLYFENRRRSGGGPLQSCCRRGSRARLLFESPEDAQSVLSRASHVLQDAHLLVQPVAPQDCGKVALRGVNPQTSLALLELYVERMLNCERGDYSICRSHAGDHALVQLQRPLSNAEFVALAEQVQRRALDGASVELDWVEQTDSLLVQSAGGVRLSRDLLELYFESKRSGGGHVRAVRLLSGGTVAVVTFEDHAVAERVLQRPHQLPDGNLAVSPYYDFLEPAEKEEVAAGGGTPTEDSGTPQICIPPMQAATQQLLQSDLVLRELEAPVPGCTLRLDGAGLRILGGEAARRQQLREHVVAALQGLAQERKPFPAWALGLLQQAEVNRRLAELLVEQRVAACYVPASGEVLVVALQPPAARLAASLLDIFLRPLSLPLLEWQLPALASPRWAQVQAGLHCCRVRLAEGGRQLEGLTLCGLEQENVAQLEAFLRDSALEECVVPMEASALRFLQLYYHEVLAGIANVSLLPLEGADFTGFRLRGEAQACQVAAELLQSLLSAVHTQTVTLQLPGINRFLLDERGQAVVRDLERRFRGIVGLERVCWSPPEAQHELEKSQEPLSLNCRRDSLPGLGQLWGSGGGAGELSRANMEEIKGLLAALQPPTAAASGAQVGQSPAVGRNEVAAAEEDLYTAPEQAEAADAPASQEEAGSLEAHGAIEGGPLPLAGPESGASEEEEAQLLLAIQQSMESAWQEEEELRRATELSLRSWEREQLPSPSATLPSGPSISQEAANIAHLVVCVCSEESVALLAQELEGALRAQLREEMVHNKALCTLLPLCHDYLAHLELKHAVHISLAGSVATVCGFVDYPVAATRDLALMLTRLLQAEAEAGAAAGGTEGIRWVHWESGGQGSPTQYSSQASALLEQAWRRGHARMDIFFDGRPFSIDFERMEEYDLGNARALPIGRSEARPVAPPAPPGSAALAEEEVKLMLLTEESAEFQETIRRFYDTLEDFHNKICIIKVEKVLHPLLYQQYHLKKAAMEKACQHQQVERVLYHGTTEQASREICQHGFNRSFCGRNATRYGHGVYFATKAFISVQDQYSPHSRDGSKYIFVTQTLVGDYTTGNQSMRAPPLRNGDAALRRYDSTVDNPHNPSIFVIFHDTQAYPQYLITCRWSKPR